MASSDLTTLTVNKDFCGENHMLLINNNKAARKKMPDVKSSKAVCMILLVFGLGEAFQVARCRHTASKCSSTSLASTTGVNGPISGRREVLNTSVATFLGILLGPQASAASTPQTILITGSNSGIGFEASKLLAEKGHTVILGCRTREKAENAIERIRDDVSAGTLVPAECNLASLNSIESFARELDVKQLDVLCLNAGLSLDAQGKEVQRTADGFELTGEDSGFYTFLERN